MKFITWQFSYPLHPTFASFAIKEKESSEICHVDVVTPDGRLLGAHIEDGVLVRNPDYMEFKVRILVTLPVTDEQYAAFWQAMNTQVGLKYNKAGIVGEALDVDVTDSGKRFCSEAQCEGIRAARILNVRKHSNLVDPEQLRLMVGAPLDSREQRVDGPVRVQYILHADGFYAERLGAAAAGGA